MWVPLCFAEAMTLADSLDFDRFNSQKTSHILSWYGLLLISFTKLAVSLWDWVCCMFSYLNLPVFPRENFCLNTMIMSWTTHSLNHLSWVSGEQLNPHHWLRDNQAGNQHVIGLLEQSAAPWLADGYNGVCSQLVAKDTPLHLHLSLSGSQFYVAHILNKCGFFCMKY